ncbi:putative PilT protein domain protein [Desulfamplus magnetovallimortis]|uniref:Putative PilT protein domain protein n=1 Tax=Desulfamplus magnetovallimortis TaxID=1246637 RepID=A0A1W1H6Q0_9BACT|nr:type II toxin-antitoxin system VapC family toxin [Desulfamplus magnetovallimortis]SLM28137.1 putative PilT protein domain protein [Desulfamplus magnetovallimortis]
MSKIYLDSCMIIGLIEGDATQRQLLKKNCIHHKIYSSELARLETRLLAIRNNNQNLLKQFDRFFVACEIINLDRDVFERATLLRSKNNIKTPDALHISAAIETNCHEFWTNDSQLIKAARQYIEMVDFEVLKTRNITK